MQPGNLVIIYAPCARWTTSGRKPYGIFGIESAVVPQEMGSITPSPLVPDGCKLTIIAKADSDQIALANAGAQALCCLEKPKCSGVSVGTPQSPLASVEKPNVDISRQAQRSIAWQ